MHQGHRGDAAPGGLRGPIVKGAQPADLPFGVVVAPRLIVNLKTAQEIGVTISPEVLKRADRVMQ